ncbi:ABC transporter permease [Pseudomonadales bacterium]|nr:ABC transporter permease [Pseudomonadales bacterium]MDB9866693.1 ABC transporter permease [Pseudomonadales bacterium]MDB9942147.1 ABC transporter permease [Pseudomonadales bacterium]
MRESSPKHQRRSILLVSAIGGAVIKFFYPLLHFTGTAWVIVKSSRLLVNSSKRRLFQKLFNHQLYSTGVRALYINVVVGALIGVLMISRLYDYLPGEALENQFGSLFVLIVIRELGPLISGLILIARSGTAVTYEIGYLQLRGELGVLRGLGVNPAFILLLPVVIAFPVSLLIMFIYFDVVVFLSSYFMIWLSDPSARFAGLSMAVLQQIQTSELLINALKALLGGLMIGLVSIHFGLKVSKDHLSISNAISTSVTIQLAVFLALNVLLSYLAYSR